MEFTKTERLKYGTKDVMEPMVETTFHGESIKFKQMWGGHLFTDAEIQELVDEKEITITTAKGAVVTGSLQEQEFQGRPYFGFKGNFDN